MKIYLTEYGLTCTETTHSLQLKNTTITHEVEEMFTYNFKTVGF